MSISLKRPSAKNEVVYVCLYQILVHVIDCRTYNRPSRQWLPIPLVVRLEIAESKKNYGIANIYCTQVGNNKLIYSISTNVESEGRYRGTWVCEKKKKKQPPSSAARAHCTSDTLTKYGTLYVNKG